jgi:hypothetical protein
VTVVTAFPVLPLADLESALLFQRVLLLHVARLKRRGDPVGFDQFLLGQALGLHTPVEERELRCAECGRPYPCRTTLLIALLTRLPVPWAPASLARALSAAALWPSREIDRDVVEDGRLEYGDRFQVDPWYRAERNPRTGRWLVRTYERGSIQATQHIDDDKDLCDFLIEQTLRLTYPYGWKTDTTWNADLDIGAARALRWWSAHRSLPYLESHRSDGAWQPHSS